MKRTKSAIKFLREIPWKLIGNCIYWLVILILVMIAGAVTFSALDIGGGIKLYTVQSGSMAPAISAGSLVISKPFNDYRAGDIITFKAEKDRATRNPRYTTTHRIKEAITRENEVFYITKGDANNSPDLGEVPRNLVLGKTVFTIPLLGFPVAFGKTRGGLILLIVIPATLIIYSELLSIKNETLKLIAERKKGRLTPKEKVEEKVGEKIIAVEKEVIGAFEENNLIKKRIKKA